jgi:hypothetical protein
MSEYRDDPNLRHRMEDEYVEPAGNSAVKWVLGGVGMLLVLGVLAFAFTNDQATTASNTRPSATAPATTTGSGGSEMPRPAAPAQQR